MYDKKEVGDRLIKLRKESGVKRWAVADAIGYSEATIKGAELRNCVSLSVVVALSEYYGVSLDYIIKGAGSTEFDYLFNRISDDKKNLAWNVVKNVLITFISGEK